MRSYLYHTRFHHTDDEIIRLDPREWMGFDGQQRSQDDEMVRLDPREWEGFGQDDSVDRDGVIRIDEREYNGDFDITPPQDDDFVRLDPREWLGFDNENSAGQHAVFDGADTQIDRLAVGSDDAAYTTTGFDTSALNQVQQQAEAASAVA